MNSNVFFCWWSHSITQFLALNDRTSNIKPNGAFTTSIKLIIKQTWTSYFWTSNRLKSVHLLVIKLKHPIFVFEQSNFEHSLTHHYYKNLPLFHFKEYQCYTNSVNTLASSNKIARCLHIILAIKSSPEIVFFLVCMSLGAPWQLLGDVVRTSRSVF